MWLPGLCLWRAHPRLGARGSPNAAHGHPGGGAEDKGRPGTREGLGKASRFREESSPGRNVGLDPRLPLSEGMGEVTAPWPLQAGQAQPFSSLLAWLQAPRRGLPLLHGVSASAADIWEQVSLCGGDSPTTASLGMTHKMPVLLSSQL